MSDRRALRFDVPAHLDRDGELRRARVVVLERVDYRSLWHRRATNTLDGLWSAACRQLRAEEVERLFDSMFAIGAHESLLSDLVDSIEREWLAAHKAFAESRHVTPRRPAKVLPFVRGPARDYRKARPFAGFTA